MNHASAAEIARSTRWLAVCLLLITFSTLSPTLGRAADWPMPDYDAGRTRHNVAEPGLLLPLPALWQSSPGQFTLFGEPIMAAGRVYSICSAPGAETRHSGVCAFDLPTGGLVWQRMIPDLFGELPPTPQAWLGWSQLSWADGRLFVVLNDPRGVGGTNRVAGLGGADGATLWLHPIAMDDDFSSAAQVMTRAPFVDDDTVILLGGLKGRTFGLATDTGMQRWAIETDEFRGCGSGMMLGGRLIQTCPSFTGAYNPATGGQLWRVVGGDRPSPAAAAHEPEDLMISVTRNLGDTHTAIQAHRGSNGSLAWTTQCTGEGSAPAISDDRIEMLCSLDDGSATTLLALDPRDGSTLEQHAVAWPAAYPVHGHDLIRVDGVLFTVGLQTPGGLSLGKILALDAASGATLWTGDTSRAASNLAFADGRLFAQGAGQVFAFGDAVSTGPPDLVVGEITFSENPRAGYPVTVRATVQNVGGFRTGPTTVDWSLDHTTVQSTLVDLAPGGFLISEFEWTPEPGLKLVDIEADPGNVVTELDESNNLTFREVDIAFQYLSVAFSADTVTRSSTGWYTADVNPLIARATARCPQDATEPCTGPLLLEVFSSDNTARFFHDAEHGDPRCFPVATGDDYSYRTLTATCDNSGSQVTLLPGESQAFELELWVQPSSASTLFATGSWIDYADDVVDIEQAEIQPVVFLHGILGSMPPQNNFITDQSTAERVIDPFLRSYYPLLVNLQKMGYTWNETLFTVAYDWRRSNRWSAAFLADHLPTILSRAADVPYVAQAPVADIVAHSMGGLVTRAYVQGEAQTRGGSPRPYQNDLGKIIFIASPHRGFPADYRTREGMTWSDYLYGTLWQNTLRFLTDNLVWPTLAAKHYDPDSSELQSQCDFFGLLDWDDQLPPAGFAVVPGFRGLEPGVYLCSKAVVKTWTQDPVDGVLSHVEMLPTEDLGVYLGENGVAYPYGRERNDFLEDLNASISTLVSRIGLDDLHVIFGDGAPETDLYYEVSTPNPPFWTHGRVTSQGTVETPRGDDLIPTPSLSLDGLVALPEGQRIELDASPNATDGDARHKEIMFHPAVQKTHVPRFLTGTSVPFETPKPLLPSPSGILSVLTACPVHLMVVDPQGRRVGYDPDTHERYDEIPDAIFTEPGQEPEMIIIPEPVPGTYTVQAAGYDEGPYSVRVDHTTALGTTPLGARAGSVIVGQSDVWEFTLSEPEPPQPVDDIATTPEDTPVMIDVLANDSDPNGEPLTVIEATVDIGAVTIEADNRLTYTPPADFEGLATISYLVRDPSGLEASAGVVVTVTGVNDPPVASIVSLLPTSGPAPLAIDLDGGGTSSDIDGTIVDWSWDLGDGTVLSGERIQHVYDLAGSRTVTLTVTDDQGATGTASLDLAATGLYSVLFVVSLDGGNLRPGDQAVFDHLDAAGIDVTPRDATVVQGSEAMGYDLVLISSTPSSSAVGSKFRDAPVPVATWEAFILDDMAMTHGVANLDYGPERDQTTVEIEPGNPIAPELAGAITLTTAPSKMTFGRPAPLAIEVARSAQRFERVLLLAYDTGDAMVGLDAPARRLSLPLSDATPTALTADGWALFDAALCWAVQCDGAPVARFSAEPQAPDSLTVTLDATASSGGNGSFVDTWTWQLEGATVTGTFGDTDVLTHTFTSAGPHLVTLAVTDAAGGSHTRSQWLQVGGIEHEALMVVGSVGLGAGDRTVHETLESLGFAVQIVGHREVTSADADGKDLVILSSTVESELVGTTFRDVAVPVITWEGHLFDDLALTDAQPSVDFDRNADQTAVDVVSPAHPVAAGLSGTVELFSEPIDVLWGRPDSAATVIATSPEDADHATVFVYEAGDDLVGHNAPARRVALPYSNLGPWFLTEDGLGQLEAAIRWAAGL